MAPSTETQLLDAIIDVCRLTGWWAHHDIPSRTKDDRWRTAIQGDAGFLDLVLARDGVVIFREVKGAYTALTAAQYEWMQRLSPGWVERRRYIPPDEALVLADVWRPMHWDTRILPLLNRPRRRGAVDYRSPVTDRGQGELPDLRDGAAPGR